MNTIMSKAWEIRKAAAAEMNCPLSEVLMSVCLEMAWAASRKTGYRVVEMYAHSGKAWVAEITGTGGRYGLERKFLAKSDVTTTGNTYREIEVAVKLTEGTVYEWSCKESSRRTERGFWIVKNGELVEVEKVKVLELVA